MISLPKRSTLTKRCECECILYKNIMLLAPRCANSDLDLSVVCLFTSPAVLEPVVVTSRNSGKGTPRVFLCAYLPATRYSVDARPTSFLYNVHLSHYFSTQIPLQWLIPVVQHPNPVPMTFQLQFCGPRSREWC